jgi:hypothetical protein
MSVPELYPFPAYFITEFKNLIDLTVNGYFWPPAGKLVKVYWEYHPFSSNTSFKMTARNISSHSQDNSEKV